MARRKKGRDIHGWLIFDKPAGMTSTAVVNKLRWTLDAKKAGHAGTLDPAATGLLAVAFGEATKTIPYVTDALKSYRFAVRFGSATNTDDAEGEVIKTSDKRPSEEEIIHALDTFCGYIQQVPPKFSAVKIDGERAYKLAREGDDPELDARPLFVESLKLVERPDADHAVFEMVCGKGGYVRAIARDLGENLGCLGHVSWLRRMWSGPFDLEDAVTIETIETGACTPALDTRVLPLETALTDLPEARLRAESVQKILNGNPGEVISTSAEFGDTAWASFDGEAIAIGTYRAGVLQPSRVFRR